MSLRGFARVAALGALLVVGSGCLWAPELDRVRKDIGLQLPGATFDKKVAFSLGPVSLWLANTTLKLVPDARDAAPYLRDLRSVKVAVYEAHNVPSDRQVRLPSRLEQLIEHRGWELVVKTNDDGQAVWILCKMKGDSIDGLYVVALDEDDLVLVRAQGHLEEMFKKAIRENARLGDNL